MAETFVDLANPQVRSKVLRLAERFLFNQNLLAGGRRVYSLGIGYKERLGAAGKEIQDLALVFFVDQKVSQPEGDGTLLDGQPKSAQQLLNSTDPDLAGRLIQTDVQEIGIIRPLGGGAAAIPGIAGSVPALFHTTYGSLRQRLRPAPPGSSIAHPRLGGAGTLGMYVKDTSGRLYALSNNHVRALERGVLNGVEIGSQSVLAAKGDIVTQPGLEGLPDPADNFGTLFCWSPIQYADTSASPAVNYADAALALVDPSLATVEFPYQTLSGAPGPHRGIAPTITEGDFVKKVGKASGLTFGRILHVGVPVRVDYGRGSAVFRNQCIATHMSVNGDSGSILLGTDSNQLYGLLFAGSNYVTMFSPLRQVLQFLEQRVLNWPSGTLSPA